MTDVPISREQIKLKKSNKKGVETFGVECIPDEARTASAMNLFQMIFGGCNTFATAVLGSFPVVYGLSFVAGFWAIVLGSLLGGIILSPMGFFGPLNGTNNAVSSGAHFGIHGRIVGSFLSLLTAVSFFSLSVWSSGDALIGGAHRLLGVTQTGSHQAIVYGLFALLVLIICIYGFRYLLWVNKLAVIASSFLFLIGIPAFIHTFHFNYAGSIHLNQPGFWAAFVASMLMAMSNPISFGAFLGDWARYIPQNTSRKNIAAAVVLSQVATLIPFIFGLGTATVVAVQAPEYIAKSDYVGGLLAISPGWYFFPVCLIAFIGGLSTGTGALYGTGLDLSSIFPRLFSRAKATILVGILAIIFIFVGRFVFNFVQSMSTFATLIVTCTTPWIIIMLIGFIKRRGWYDTYDLQAFNRGERGGRYWFSHGWNWRGLGAWIPSAVIGLMFVNMPGQFIGPFGSIAGGVDISLPIAIALATCLYLSFLTIYPEPSAVFKHSKDHVSQQHKV